MSDALYLSLWYPNLRLAGLADKLTAVLGVFADHGGEPLVYSATVWPVSWHEAPVFQRVWGRAAAPQRQVDRGQDARQEPAQGGPAPQPARLGVEPRSAVAEAMELLHEDYAYEFQIGWRLWELENGAGMDPRWFRVSRLVRVTGYGPLFDEGAYEQEGHIRIDFGSDEPFLEEETSLDPAAATHMAENVRQLVDLTGAAEKASGATARLLWSELGESLAQRLAARLSQGN